MFGGETADKYVKVLSGGERSRLAMIKLLLEPVNLLILDEPTNHLDMVSKEVLKEAIRAFDGTAIIVSHDREFLDGLVSKVYEFGHGQVREHIGGIYDYIRKRNAGSIQEAIDRNIAPTQDSKPEIKKLRKAERAVEESEKKISQMEKRINELDQLLMKPEKASDMTLVTEYTELKRTLDDENNRWLKLSEELEQLK